MNKELSERLRELGDAISEAVWNSAEVTNALAALKRTGREVQIGIDAVLLDADPRVDDPSAVVPTSDGVSPFDDMDRLFLRELKISAS
jgi:hypothetical protein